MKNFNFNLKKALSILVITVLLFDLSFLPVSLYAQETEGSVESSSTLQTGDANSQAQSENVVNVNITQVEGSVEGESCGADVSLECSVETQNQAQVEQETGAESTSGENEAQSPDQSIIETGDSTSTSQSENILNLNIIEATEEGGLAIEENGEENNGETKVDIENEAELVASSSAESTSGLNENSAEETLIETGDSAALSSLFNLINTNIIGSNFRFIILDIEGYYEQDIDLNQIWLELEKGELSEENANKLTDIFLKNIANVQVYSSATSTSGGNETESYGSEILTGDSLAASNMVNIINLNVIGSTFFIPIINIFGTFKGNIILPSKERFNSSATAGNGINENEIDITNIVEIESDSNSDSLSGGNEQEGIELLLATGDSESQSTSTSYLNLNILLSNWYKIFINNFGAWFGNYSLFGLNDQVKMAQYSVEESDGLEINSLEEDDESSNIEIYNQAKVRAESQALSISGNNKAKSLMSLMTTGFAKSFSNIFNLINTNIIGSRFMMPIITLFNSWEGDVEYAYPDLSISISADKKEVKKNDTINYTVSFQNKGKDVAKNANIQTVLPAAEEFTQGDSQVQSSGRVLNLSLGTVNPNNGGSFSFQTTLNNIDSGQNEFTTVAYITSSDVESDNSNNSSSATKTLETESESDNRLPQLGLTAKANTGEYVNAGDTVTFEVDVKNHGEGVSKETFVYQTIVNESGQQVSYTEINLGDINSHNQTNVSFGIKIPNSASSGVYRSYITAEGKANDGSSHSSNTAENAIPVKGKFLNFAGNVDALENNVKGSFKGKPNKESNEGANYLPYLLAALLIGFWFIDLNKDKILAISKRRKMKIN